MSNNAKEQDTQERSPLIKSTILNTKEKQPGVSNKLVGNNQDTSKQVNIKDVVSGARRFYSMTTRPDKR